VSAGSRLALIPLVLILLLAAGLRWHHVDTQSLWNDEGSSVVQARRTLPEIAANAARDIHPPGYYGLLAGWRALTGERELALRSFSVLVSVLSVAAVAALGRLLGGTVMGCCAALIVSLNTFHIYYAQEARMYALLGLWGALGMWWVARGCLRPQTVSWRWIIGLAVINAAGLYTQYAYPFVMLVQGVIVVVYGLWRNPARRTLWFSFTLANLLALILFLPWLPTALQQITTWPSTGQPIPPAEVLTTILSWFTFGLSYSSIPNALAYLPLGLGTLGIGLLLWSRHQRTLRTLLIPLCWALLPVLLFLVLGLFRPANLKFLLPSQIGFGLLMGAGLAAWWQLARQDGRTNRMVLVFVILQSGWLITYLGAGVSALYSDAAYQRADYRAMVRAILRDPVAGDAVILDAPNQEEVFRYYYQGDAPVYPLPPGLGGNDAETLTRVQEVIANHDRIFVLFWGEAERDPNRIVETTLDQQAFEAGEDRWYGDVRFAQYVTPATLLPALPLSIRFGESILLQTAALNARTFTAGETLQVELVWQTEAILSRRYKVFVQVLNAGGVLVAQRDAEPVGNTLPTTAWQVDEPVQDRHAITLGADLPAGDYTVILGLYDIDDPAQRLLTLGDLTYLPLTQVTINSP
jgi:mannosyltransferase